MVLSAGNVNVLPRMGLRYVNVMPGILTMEIPVKVGKISDKRVWEVFWIALLARCDLSSTISPEVQHCVKTEL